MNSEQLTKEQIAEWLNALDQDLQKMRPGYQKLSEEQKQAYVDTLHQANYSRNHVIRAGNWCRWGKWWDVKRSLTSSDFWPNDSQLENVKLPDMISVARHQKQMNELRDKLKREYEALLIERTSKVPDENRELLKLAQQQVVELMYNNSILTEEVQSLKAKLKRYTDRNGDSASENQTRNATVIVSEPCN